MTWTTLCGWLRKSVSQAVTLLCWVQIPVLHPVLNNVTRNSTGHLATQEVLITNPSKWPFPSQQRYHLFPTVQTKHWEVILLSPSSHVSFASEPCPFPSDYTQDPVTDLHLSDARLVLWHARLHDCSHLLFASLLAFLPTSFEVHRFQDVHFFSHLATPLKLECILRSVDGTLKLY